MTFSFMREGAARKPGGASTLRERLPNPKRARRRGFQQDADPAGHFELAAHRGSPTVGLVSSQAPDKTRVLLAITALLWLSALAALFIGFKLRLRPIMLLGVLNVLLALFASTLISVGRRRR